MAMSPEEAQRARIKAALDRVGSLNPADPPEGLRAPRAGPVPSGGPQQGFVSPAAMGPRQPTSAIPPSPQQPAPPPAPPKFGPGPIPPAPGPTNTTSYADKIKSPQARAFQAQQAANSGPQMPAGAKPAQTPRPTSYDIGRQAGERARVSAGGDGGGKAGLLAGIGIASAADSMGRSSDDYARRLGMDPASLDPTPGKSMLTDPAFYKGLGARTAGVMSDFGAAVLDAPVGAVNTVSQFLGREGNLRLPGGSFTEILRRQDNPQAAAEYEAANTPSSLRSAAPTQPAATQPAATQSQVRASEPQEPAAPGNVVTVRNGNQFSGEDVREGFRYEGTLRRMPGEYGLTSMPASNFASASPSLDEARAAALANLTPAQAADYLNGSNYAGGSTPGMGGFGSGTLSSAANERFDAGRAPEVEKQRQADLQKEQMRTDAQRYEVDAQVQSGLRSDATTRRGQNMDLLGRETTARATLRSAERAAEKDAFDRELRLAEFGAGQENKAFERKQTREANLQRNIEATNTTMVDGKPVVNAAAAAEYRRGIDRSVARLGLDGVDKLSPRAEQQLFAASDLLRTMRENASWVPWAPDALKTVDPLDLTDLYVAKNGDRVITREGRAKGQTIPARFFDTEEGNRIRMFGTPTNKYDILASQTGN